MDGGKILLIAKDHIVEPLGIMFLASAAKNVGYKPEFRIFEDVFQAAHVYLFEDFNYVGFSISTGGHQEILNSCKYLKEKGVKTIIGGHHPTNFYAGLSDYSNYIVVGEGIGALKDILRGGSEGVYSGYLTDPVDLGVPDRKIVYDAYPKYAKSEVKSVISSFGCPYSCSYCFNGSYRNLYLYYKVRFREVEDVIKECEELKNYNTKLIYFQDDCFGINRDWLLEFVQEYKKRVKIPFHCQTRFEFINDEYLLLLQLGGCIGLTMAIESANEGIRRELLKRNTTNAAIYEGAHKVKKIGFRLRTEQMLGLPETTIDDDLDLIRMNNWMRPTYAWASTFVPYLGTPLGDYCKDKGIYSGNNDELNDHFFARSRLNFDRRRIEQIEYLQNFFGIICKVPFGHVMAREFVNSELSLENFNRLHRRHVYKYELYETRK